ncbi:hypothetical protein KFL_002940100 [Klebsormidium nitens]|uniref:Uncharacterized protein n=1 Tax=Klebsormidium nitens TaxID=105231 RepID=A0A1Y1I6D9_KLENI|nr:hypothetical protein KFL_002940100 [Klebsormidium nitens]|eukprot:GAQ86524.1 hypothetical protein KFL_002940100 [Klebsormidium nitens]
MASHLVPRLSLLVVAFAICPSYARIICQAPCADASNSSFARAPVSGTALDEYVAKVDVAYGWHETGRVMHGVLPFSTWTGHMLNMTSQRCLTEKDTSCSVWTHTLVVIVPGNLQFTRTALLLVSEGSNTSPPPTAFDSFILMAAALAVKTHSVTAVLYQVPNQPCTFADDPDGRPRSEDALIAFTWRHFLDHPDEVEWPARFPMVKAAVRAMDTVQAYARQLLGNQIENFAVVGASKRGWVAWLTAAVDKRVTCAVPIVMDLLNAQANLAHFYRSLGGWPFTFRDYYDLNITRDLTTPGMDRLWALIDGYQYRDRLMMPKLLVTTSQDEFFMIDDGRFFWDALPGEKHALILANTEHTLITSIAKLVKAIAAFHLSVMDSQRAHDLAGGSERVADQGGGRSISNQGGAHSVPNQGGADSALSEGVAAKMGGAESASSQGAAESASKRGDAAGSAGGVGTDKIGGRVTNRGKLEAGSLVIGLAAQRRGRDGQGSPSGNASEVRGPISGEEEGGDEVSRRDIYRMCGTPRGLQTVYRALLDESRPWRFRWLEGILDAFGGEDVARWKSGGEDGEVNRGAKRAQVQGGKGGASAGVESEDFLSFPSKAAQGGGIDDGGRKEVARFPGVGAGADAGGGNGLFLALPSENTRDVELSQEEKDWERECAKQVQAREGGLLQLAEPYAATPLGGGPGRARPKYRYELHREEGRIEIFCTDVPQKIIQWSAYTPPGNDRRDFRFVTRDYGNCSTFRIAGGCVQPFCFTPRALKPRGPNLGDGVRYEARLAPPGRGYGAFFVEMRWRGLWDRPLYVFSTPALVVPDTYPFEDCRFAQGGCTGRLL